MSKKKVIGWILFVIWCGFILWMTLFSRIQLENRVFRPTLFYEFRELIIGAKKGVIHSKMFLENILLFIPFGFLFPYKEHRHSALITGCAFSILIEITQYVTMFGECEIDDVIANSTGALIGFLLFKILTLGCRRIKAQIKGRKIKNGRT